MLRQGPGEKFGKAPKKNINEEEKEITIGEDSLLNAKYDTTEINNLKDTMRSKAKFLLKELDLKHAALRNISYNPCFDNQCLKLYENLMKSEKETHKISENENKLNMFVHNDNLEQAKLYNSCVEGCQEDLRTSRFMVEIQLKEWQYNINECFHYCKYDNAEPVQCITYCCKRYNSILDEVQDRLYDEYDTKIKKYTL